MRRRAFTLIEATVVCAIIAMIAALALPNLVAMKANQEQREAYNAILRLAQRGREASIQEGRTYVLTLNQTSKVTLQRDPAQPKDSTDDPRQAPPTDENSREDVASVDLPDGVTVGDVTLDGKPSSASDFVLHFYPDGRSEGGGFELVQDAAKRSLSMDTRGIATLQDGQLPAAGQNRWEAGQYEQRVTG